MDLLKTIAQLPVLTKPIWLQPDNLPLTAEKQAETLTAAHKKELAEL